MKTLHECRETHVLWAIWDTEFDGDIRFLIWPEEGQCHDKFKLGQMSKFKIFLPKHTYPVQLCVRIPNLSFIFAYGI